MTAKSTLIELSKRLSDIESLIGHVDKDVADDRNSEMTLETRGHNIRKFLNTFGEFFENEKEFNDILNVSTKGLEDTTVQETLILNFAEANDVNEESLDVIRNASTELSCEIDDESQRRLERAAKRSTEITVRTEELRRRVQNLATIHHKMMEMLSLKFVGVDKLLSEIENKG